MATQKMLHALTQFIYPIFYRFWMLFVLFLSKWDIWDSFFLFVTVKNLFKTESERKIGKLSKVAQTLNDLRSSRAKSVKRVLELYSSVLFYDWYFRVSCVLYCVEWLTWLDSNLARHMTCAQKREIDRLLSKRALIVSIQLRKYFKEEGGDAKSAIIIQSLLRSRIFKCPLME